MGALKRGAGTHLKTMVPVVVVVSWLLSHEGNTHSLILKYEVYIEERMDNHVSKLFALTGEKKLR